MDPVLAGHVFADPAAAAAAAAAMSAVHGREIRASSQPGITVKCLSASSWRWLLAAGWPSIPCDCVTARLAVNKQACQWKDDCVLLQACHAWPAAAG